MFRASAFLLSLMAAVLPTSAASAQTVTDRDTAITIAKAACGGALDLPASDNPRWDAQMLDDHWSARLLSDYAPYFDNALMSVDVRQDGTTSDCIVHVGH